MVKQCDYTPQLLQELRKIFLSTFPQDVSEIFIKLITKAIIQEKRC